MTKKIRVDDSGGGSDDSDRLAQAAASVKWAPNYLNLTELSAIVCTCSNYISLFFRRSMRVEHS